MRQHVTNAQRKLHQYLQSARTRWLQCHNRQMVLSNHGAKTSLQHLRRVQRDPQALRHRITKLRGNCKKLQGACHRCIMSVRLLLWMSSDKRRTRAGKRTWLQEGGQGSAYPSISSESLNNPRSAGTTSVTVKQDASPCRRRINRV